MDTNGETSKVITLFSPRNFHKRFTLKVHQQKSSQRREIHNSETNTHKHEIINDCAPFLPLKKSTKQKRKKKAERKKKLDWWNKQHIVKSRNMMKRDAFNIIYRIGNHRKMHLMVKNCNADGFAPDLLESSKRGEVSLLMHSFVFITHGFLDEVLN